MRQLELDALLRAALQKDQRISYALAYGSLTQGGGDRFSNVEYYAYTDELFPAQDWLGTALHGTEFSLLHSVVNEFGTPNFVVSGLIRIELHVQRVAEIPNLLNWPSEHLYPANMLVKDQDGKLAAFLHQLASKPACDPRGEAQLIFDRTVNWLVFGVNVLRRGERARALELLWWVQGGLLRLARLAALETTHWLNPYRLAERELPPELLARYAAATGGLSDLERTYAAAWAWLQELTVLLGLPFDPALGVELTATLAE